MIHGFTGTRAGMSENQKKALSLLVCDQSTATAIFHHGGCHGADCEAHWIVGPHAARYVHPGDEDQHRKWTIRSDYAVVCHWKPYLERNHDIVDVCEVLIAAPSSLTEELRSGTWATIRYARKIGRPVIILDP